MALSALYWETRYRGGGNSGDGSSGDLAQFKADYLNTFVQEQAISSVVEFGCGDGRQLALAEYPAYLGLDVSPAAVQLCEWAFSADPAKAFALLPVVPVPRDLALSLDVIYHLYEDDVYQQHLAAVFAAASRFVVLYTTDADELGEEWTAPHVRHRPVVTDVAERFPAWRLLEHIENPYPGLGGSDFYAYEPVA